MRRFTLAILCVGAAAAIASADVLYAVDDGNDTLFTIDTDTFATNTIGSLNTGGDFGDLAYDPASGTMYYVGGRGNNALYSVNLATGAATLVGSHGIEDMFALGVDGRGELYGQSTSGNVYRLDSSNGAATFIGANGVYPGGYDWHPSLGMVFLEAGGGGIYNVDLSNGAAGLIASPGSINDCDITYQPSLDVFWAADWSGNLFTYDSAFNRTQVFAGLPLVAAIEYVPAPSALAVLGLGALAAARRRR